MTSEQLFERSLRVAPGGVHSPVRAFKSVGGTPVFFASAEGATITSVEGHTYIDFCQSFGPHLLGHRDPDVAAKVHEMVDRLWAAGACEPYSLELAEWVTGQLPFVEKMRFVTSGTEAVMSALRVARGATGRDKVLKFEGCYHGHVDSLLVKAGSGLAGAAAADSAGVSSAVAATTLVTPLDDEAKLEEIFAKEGPNIAAVILEPLPANYGLLVQREEFWRRTLDLARRHGALVIFDEVISGFRVAMGGMAERLRMSPDLVTYGKILGGGLPVGAYGGRRDLLDLVAPSGPVYQAGTLSAGSLGMAAGLATLEKARRLNVHSILEHRTERFARELNSRFARADLPFLVDHVGSIFWIRPHSLGPIRTIAQIPSNHGAQFKRLFQACLKRGVYLAPSGYEVGFVTLAHTDAVLEKAIEAISAAAQEAHGPT